MRCRRIGTAAVAGAAGAEEELLTLPADEKQRIEDAVSFSLALDRQHEEKAKKRKKKKEKVRKRRGRNRECISIGAEASLFSLRRPLLARHEHRRTVPDARSSASIWRLRRRALSLLLGRRGWIRRRAAAEAAEAAAAAEASAKTLAVLVVKAGLCCLRLVRFCFDPSLVAPLTRSAGADTRAL
jgi:hypothetical protein